MEKVITELSCNSSIYPVMNFRKNVINLPFTKEEFKIPVFNIDQLWNHENFMILDIIATEYANKFFEPTYNGNKCNYLENVIPSVTSNMRVNNYTSKVLEKEKLQLYINSNEEQLKQYNVQECIYFSDNDLISKYNFLEKYSSGLLLDLIMNTSKIKFKMNYRVKTFNSNTQCFETNIIKLENWLPLFDCQIIEKSENKRGLKKVDYKISFSNPLSMFFIYNIRSVNYTTIPKNFFKLEKLTQLLYRKCILLEFKYFKKCELKITPEKIVNRLNLVTYNNKIIHRCFDDLINNGMIGKFEKYKHDYVIKKYKEKDGDKEIKK